MRYPYIVIILLAIVVIGLTGVSYTYYTKIEFMHNTISSNEVEIQTLNDEIQVRDTELNLRAEQINYMREQIKNLISLRDKLNETRLQLEEEKGNLEEDNTALEKEVSTTKTAIDDSIRDLLDYEEEIAESMKWFQKNSNLGYFDEWRQMKQFIRGWCADINEERCTIKIACLTFVTDYLGEFGYKVDAYTVNKTDFLQNLTQIYNNKGGDCEDYSLLGVASLNYLEDYCIERDAPEIKYVAWVHEDGKRHYVEDTGKYYLPDTTNYDIPYTGYQIVCGTFPIGYDPNRGGVGKGGHCVLGFSDVKVESSLDVPKFLESAILIEPQNGAFMADLSEPTVFQIPQNGEEKGEFPLTIVITTQDLYLFGEVRGENKWQGYADYVKDIDILRARLIELKKEV